MTRLILDANILIDFLTRQDGSLTKPDWKACQGRMHQALTEITDSESVFALSITLHESLICSRIAGTETLDRTKLLRLLRIELLDTDEPSIEGAAVVRAFSISEPDVPKLPMLDCLVLAKAKREDLTVVTSDDKMHNVAQASGIDHVNVSA